MKPSPSRLQRPFDWSQRLSEINKENIRPTSPLKDISDMLRPYAALEDDSSVSGSSISDRAWSEVDTPGSTTMGAIMTNNATMHNAPGSTTMGDTPACNSPMQELTSEILEFLQSRASGDRSLSTTECLALHEEIHTMYDLLERLRLKMREHLSLKHPSGTDQDVMMAKELKFAQAIKSLFDRISRVEAQVEPTTVQAQYIKYMHKGLDNLDKTFMVTGPIAQLAGDNPSRVEEKAQQDNEHETVEDLRDDPSAALENTAVHAQVIADSKQEIKVEVEAKMVLENTIKELELDLTATRGQLDTPMDESSSLYCNHEEADLECENFDEENDGLKEELGSLKTRYKVLKARCEVLTAKAKAALGHRDQFAKLVDIVKAGEEERRSLQVKLVEAKATMQEAQKERDASDARLLDALRELTTVKAELAKQATKLSLEEMEHLNMLRMIDAECDFEKKKIMEFRLQDKATELQRHEEQACKTSPTSWRDYIDREKQNLDMQADKERIFYSILSGVAGKAGLNDERELHDQPAGTSAAMHSPVSLDVQKIKETKQPPQGAADHEQEIQNMLGERVRKHKLLVERQEERSRDFNNKIKCHRPAEKDASKHGPERIKDKHIHMSQQEIVDTRKDLADWWLARKQRDAEVNELTALSAAETNRIEDDDEKKARDLQPQQKTTSSTLEGPKDKTTTNITTLLSHGKPLLHQRPEQKSKAEGEKKAIADNTIVEVFGNGSKCSPSKPLSTQRPSRMILTENNTKNIPSVRPELQASPILKDEFKLEQDSKPEAQEKSASKEARKPGQAKDNRKCRCSVFIAPHRHVNDEVFNWPKRSDLPIHEEPILVEQSSGAEVRLTMEHIRQMQKGRERAYAIVCGHEPLPNEWLKRKTDEEKKTEPELGNQILCETAEGKLAHEGPSPSAHLLKADPEAEIFKEDSDKLRRGQENDKAVLTTTKDGDAPLSKVAPELQVTMDGIIDPHRLRQDSKPVPTTIKPKVIPQPKIKVEWSRKPDLSREPTGLVIGEYSYHYPNTKPAPLYQAAVPKDNTTNTRRVQEDSKPARTIDSKDEYPLTLPRTSLVQKPKEDSIRNLEPSAKRTDRAMADYPHHAPPRQAVFFLAPDSTDTISVRERSKPASTNIGGAKIPLPKATVLPEVASDPKVASEPSDYTKKVRQASQDVEKDHKPEFKKVMTDFVWGGW
ncbi:hypothetical protein K461DRAFT_271419 [Myriangium duriaei CBS 260.36]|uniref:Uncharacterized protein n=1 Tax=Myriangium duriaei CBS 260.36 TaxID=1168546 RepID=A0A9P4MGC7_9PEZI|nr:hypothetical protein K461DRAFT_271419 [Myriangium duriaei CBS 260.36]